MMVDRIIEETGLSVMPVGHYVTEKHDEYALPFSVCPNRILTELEIARLKLGYNPDVPKSNDDPHFLKPNGKLYVVFRW
jgi:hypothetical protein